MRSGVLWKGWQGWALLAILLVAFALRIYQLDSQSLWYDESDRVFIASLPVAQIFPTMAEEGLHYLPLYFFLLKPFTVPFHEWGVRFPSVALGVLAVVLAAQAARVLWGRWAALPAALLLTVSPFHVWFSRDASFYALVTLSAVGTLYFFVRLLRKPRWLLWAGLAFFSSLGLCTHYFAFALPVVCLIYILLTWRKNWKLLRPWMLSQVVAFAPLAPWYAFVVLRRKFYFGSAATQPPRLVDLLYTWRNFSIGNTGDLTWEVPVAVALCGALLVLAIIQIARTRRGAGRAALLLLWLFLPITMAYLMSFRVPMYVDRYLIPTFPAFILLVVGGMTALPLGWRGGALTILVLVSGVGTSRIYFDSAYAKEDWRGVARAIQAAEQPGDVIMPLLYQSLTPLHGQYYRGKSPIEPIEVGAQVRDPAGLAAGYRRAWLIVPHPHNSIHLLARCQSFDVYDFASYGSPPPAEYREWLTANRSQVVEVRSLTCLKLLLFDLQSPRSKP